jgi:hypothetical protein
MGDRPGCRVCGVPILEFAGPMAASALILSSRPNQEEVNKGTPFAGKFFDPMRAEFSRLNLDYRMCRVGYLWPHVRPEKKADIRCLAYGVERVLQEAKGRKYIFAMGDDIANWLTGQGALEWCGLPAHSNQISVPIYICVDPNYLAFRGPGEFRLALENFRKSQQRGQK